MHRPSKKTTPFLSALALAAALSACSREEVCPSDQALCRDGCTSLATDPANCGACDTACGAGQVCTAGKCEFGTAQNCGALGRTCGSGERCVSGDRVADLYLACFNTNEVREATFSLAAAGLPVPTTAGPVALAWLGDTLFVADSLDNTVDVLRFDPPAVRSAGKITIPAAAVGYSDLEFLAAANGLLYVSNAAANTIDVLDPVHLDVLDEIPLDPGFNPAGILVVSAAKAYVALNGSDEVVVLDVSTSGSCSAPPCGSVTKRIALPAALAGAGGQPMPSRLALVNGKLYVTLANLKFVPAPVYVTPAGDGALAVIDTSTDTLVTTPGSFPVDLGPACLDPGDVAVRGQVLYVTCGFPPIPPATGVTGGGIVPVDVSPATPAVGAALALPDHAPGALVFCGGAGYAGDRASGSVLKYDPGTNTVTSTQPLCPPPNPGAASFVAAVACGI